MQGRGEPPLPAASTDVCLLLLELRKQVSSESWELPLSFVVQNSEAGSSRKQKPIFSLSLAAWERNGVFLITAPS